MPTEASTGNGDQRVTNARILSAVDRLQDDINQISQQMTAFDSRQRLDHDLITRMCNQIDTNRDEIGKLRDQSTRQDWITTVFALITSTVAGIIGVNK